MSTATAGVMKKALEQAQTQLDNYKQVSSTWVPPQNSGTQHATRARGESHKSASKK